MSQTRPKQRKKTQTQQPKQQSHTKNNVNKTKTKHIKKHRNNKIQTTTK